MWLVDVDTYELVNVPNHIDDKHVRYAILSHRWEDDEVTFEDMQQLQLAKQKAGFWKISMTCEQAKKDGLEYAWIDTCCIDKRSSAELQEAINSMFLWYAKGSVCYAYLSDIKESSEIYRSKWFTRGWTLQELLAPRTLQFFSSGWFYLDSRDSVVCSGMIAWTTGIDIEILQRTNDIFLVLSRYSVAARMSWAAGRETARLEDRAYSLLGLFEVAMPMLYGEGERAFIRLQEEILRSNPDLSLLCWNWHFDDPSHLSNDLLATSPEFFSACSTFTHKLSSRGIDGASSRTISSIGLIAKLPVLIDTSGPLSEDALVLLDCFDSNYPTCEVASRAGLEKANCQWGG